MTVPYTFGNESSPIPLSQLDANFAAVPNYANTAGYVTNSAQANITSVGTLTALSVAGNIIGGNLSTAGLVLATGSITGGNLLTTGQISAFGTVTGGNITTGGNISADIINATTLIYTANNVSGGNIYSAGIISAGGNILAQGIMSATGNIETAQYFIGNFQGNITGNLSVGGSNTQVLFNNNGNVGAAGGLTYNSGSNTLGILGVVSAQGNIIGGNLKVNGTTQLVGVATAPTAPNGTANNQVATTAFVSTTVGTLGTMATQNAVSVAITGGTIGNGILTLATISNSNISGTTISGGNISGTTISGGNISGTTISGGNISGTTISGGNISGTTISGGNISGTTISGGNISGLVNPISVSDGGTSSTSLTQNAVILGNGTSALQTVIPGTSGNILASNGTTWTSTALSSLIKGLGFGGETWHDVTGTRSSGVPYTNNHGYPIQVSAWETGQYDSNCQFLINGSVVAFWGAQFNGAGAVSGITGPIVPPGATYQINTQGGGITGWWELY